MALVTSSIRRFSSSSQQLALPLGIGAAMVAIHLVAAGLILVRGMAVARHQSSELMLWAAGGESSSNRSNSRQMPTRLP